MKTLGAVSVSNNNHWNVFNAESKFVLGPILKNEQMLTF